MHCADGYGKGHKGGATPALWVVPGAHQFAHSIGVTALAVSNNGTYIATGGEGGEVRWAEGRRGAGGRWEVTIQGEAGAEGVLLPAHFHI